MKVLVASDHGGYSLKQEILKVLKQMNIPFADLGSDSEASVDYPDYAEAVALKVSKGEADRGILVCGTGAGMAITANKFKGVRASIVSDLYTAQMTRQHNDLNVLCLGGRILSVTLACEIVKIFLVTPFEGGRHERRINKIKDLEKKNC